MKRQPMGWEKTWANYVSHGFLQFLNSKESACSAGDAEDSGSIPGLEKSFGGGYGNPLQYYSLENPMNRGA